MAHIKQLAGQTAIYGVSSILGRLLNYLLVPVYTRIFEPAQYGIVTEFYAYVTFLLVIYTYGMETAYFRFSNNSQQSEEKIFNNSLFSLLISSFLFSGILILFSQSIAGAIGYPDNPEYIIWFAVILAADAITSIPFGRLRRQNKVKKFAAIKVFTIVLNVIFNLFFLVLCPYLIKTDMAGFINFIYNPEIDVGYVFISNLLSSVITILMLWREFSFFKPKLELILWKEMIIYSLPLLIAGFAGMINETIDRILIKYLLPAEENPLEQLGIYGANYKLAIFMTLFIQAFRYAAEPFFFAQTENKDKDKVYAEVMNYFIFAGSVIYLSVVIYLNAIKYLIGDEYHSGLHIVPILLLANLFLGIYFNLTIWFKISNKTSWGAIIAITGAIITITLNLLLIPEMGYTGAAWTTLICYLSMTILGYFLGQKYYPVKYNVNRGISYISVAILIVIIKEVAENYFHLNEFVVMTGGTILLLLFIAGGYLLETSKKSVS